MKYRSKDTVWKAAEDRISWMFDEFKTVVVCFSGGKDSTVLLEMVLAEARRRDKLPVPVLWIDQEAEFQATVDYVKEVMYRPEVKPYWLQIPMKMFNATSFTEHWLELWDPEQEDKWVHERDPIAITENRYGTDRFAELFPRICDIEWPEGPVCMTSGVRCEESPTRQFGLTSAPCWKHITWGKKHKRDDQVSLYPLYDWSYTDIWKSIHDNGWNYNKIYDFQYRYGVNINKMRVSNLHHETAIHQLFYLQEIEKETYDRLVKRLPGVHAACQAGKDDYFINDLPFMFGSWREYRDYLMEKLLTPEYREKMLAHFNVMDERYPWVSEHDRSRTQVQSIVTNDHEGVKIKNWMMRMYYEKYKKDKEQKSSHE